MLVSRANSYYENRIHVILLIPLLFTFKNRKLTYMKYVYRFDDGDEDNFSLLKQCYFTVINMQLIELQLVN